MDNAGPYTIFLVPKSSSPQESDYIAYVDLDAVNPDSITRNSFFRAGECIENTSRGFYVEIKSNNSALTGYLHPPYDDKVILK